MSPAGDPQRSQDQHVASATCLGCGCACDDIDVHVIGNRIASTANACPLGREWFGDGSLPAAIRVDNRERPLDAAVEAIAGMLAAARAPQVYLAPGLSCEAQREATALADLLHASVDSVTRDTALASILAAQERGRAGATLGEIRNRADVILFWAVDPDERYPRYRSRYAPDPAGIHVRNGRRDRTVVAVDIGDRRGPSDADVRISIAPPDEVAVLTMTAAIVARPDLNFGTPLENTARLLAERLSSARYSAIVADGEVSSTNDLRPQFPDLQRGGALIALSQALNGPSRCALSTLRGGGNRSGADAVLTSQTGYPLGVDFSRGFPVYRPYDDHASADVTLIAGDAGRISALLLARFARTQLAIVGPGASTHGGARVAIDTGIAGIHCGGTAMRMDDVALPLRASITGHRDPADVITMLTPRLRAVLAAANVSDDPSPRNAGRTTGTGAARHPGP
jgi:formylmethanofuran dehydrogenase subunit B